MMCPSSTRYSLSQRSTRLMAIRSTFFERDGQFIVYSVGQNLVDNKGESSGRDADDFAVKFDVTDFSNQFASKAHD